MCSTNSTLRLPAKLCSSNPLDLLAIVLLLHRHECHKYKVNLIIRWLPFPFSSSSGQESVVSSRISNTSRCWRPARSASAIPSATPATATPIMSCRTRFILDALPTSPEILKKIIRNSVTDGIIRALVTEEERMFAHGLEAGLTIVEESSVSGCKEDEHSLFGLHFASLQLCLQEAASFGRYSLNSKEKYEVQIPPFISFCNCFIPRRYLVTSRRRCQSSRRSPSHSSFPAGLRNCRTPSVQFHKRQKREKEMSQMPFDRWRVSFFCGEVNAL